MTQGGSRAGRTRRVTGRGRHEGLGWRKEGRGGAPRGQRPPRLGCAGGGVLSRHCFAGPTRKDVAPSERMLPAVYLKAKGSGLPSSNFAIERSEVSESSVPSARQQPAPMSRCLNLRGRRSVRSEVRCGGGVWRWRVEVACGATIRRGAMFDRGSGLHVARQPTELHGCRRGDTGSEARGGHVRVGQHLHSLPSRVSGGFSREGSDTPLTAAAATQERRSHATSAPRLVSKFARVAGRGWRRLRDFPSMVPFPPARSTHQRAAPATSNVRTSDVRTSHHPHTHSVRTGGSTHRRSAPPRRAPWPRPSPRAPCRSRCCMPRSQPPWPNGCRRLPWTRCSWRSLATDCSHSSTRPPCTRRGSLRLRAAGVGWAAARADAR